MASLHCDMNVPAAAPAATGDHAVCGGARERWDLVRGPETKTATASGTMRTLAESGIASAFAGAGGSAAVSVRQPVQQSSIQVLLVPLSGEGACPPAKSVWQMMPPGCTAAAAAICAPLKFAIRLESAIA